MRKTSFVWVVDLQEHVQITTFCAENREQLAIGDDNIFQSSPGLLRPQRQCNAPARPSVAALSKKERDLAASTPLAR